MSVQDVRINDRSVRRVHDNLYQEVSPAGESAFLTQEQVLEKAQIGGEMTEEQIAELGQKLSKMHRSVMYH